MIPRGQVRDVPLIGNRQIVHEGLEVRAPHLQPPCPDDDSLSQCGHNDTTPTSMAWLVRVQESFTPCAPRVLLPVSSGGSSSANRFASTALRSSILFAGISHLKSTSAYTVTCASNCCTKSGVNTSNSRSLRGVSGSARERHENE